MYLYPPDQTHLLLLTCLSNLLQPLQGKWYFLSFEEFTYGIYLRDLPKAAPVHASCQ